MTCFLARKLHTHSHAKKVTQKTVLPLSICILQCTEYKEQLNINQGAEYRFLLNRVQNTEKLDHASKL